MTVAELIGLNPMITDVVIEVRENGCKLVDALHIGMDYGVKPPYPQTVSDGKSANGRKETPYIRKSINSWDDGAEYWQSKPQRLPAKWRNLEVFSFQFRYVYLPHHPRADVNPSREYNGIEITALPSGETLEVKEAAKDNNDVDEKGQLVGQMSFMEE